MSFVVLYNVKFTWLNEASLQSKVLREIFQPSKLSIPNRPDFKMCFRNGPRVAWQADAAN